MEKPAVCLELAVSGVSFANASVVLEKIVSIFTNKIWSHKILIKVLTIFVAL